MAQRRPLKAASAGAGVQTARTRGIASFFRETWSEFKKVVWPTRNETVRLTAIVIAITAALGLILGGIDLVFLKLVGFLGGTS